MDSFYFKIVGDCVLRFGIWNTNECCLFLSPTPCLDNGMLSLKLCKYTLATWPMYWTVKPVHPDVSTLLACCSASTLNSSLWINIDVTLKQVIKICKVIQHASFLYNEKKHSEENTVYSRMPLWAEEILRREACCRTIFGITGVLKNGIVLGIKHVFLRQSRRDNKLKMKPRKQLWGRWG